jgi:hypothetical protein
MNGYGNFAAVWSWGDGVKYACSFPTAERRQEVMDHALEGRQEGLWSVKCSDGVERKLRTAISCSTVAVVQRREAVA